MKLKNYTLVKVQMKRDYSGTVIKPVVSSHGPVFASASTE